MTLENSIAFYDLRYAVNMKTSLWQRNKYFLQTKATSKIQPLLYYSPDWVFVHHHRFALGKFRSVGGVVAGNSNNAGAAGTVYKYESRRGPQYRELKYYPESNLTSFKPEHAKVKVDNENNDVATPTVIMENQTVFYEFDEMQVEGRAWFILSDKSVLEP